MPTILRRTVGALALFAASAAAVAARAGYFLVAYSSITETLTFKSRLNAARFAQYIDSHGVMWQYQQLRLEELIQLPEIGDLPVRQLVYGQKGEHVFEIGAPLSVPVIARHTQIFVSGAVVGDLVVEAPAAAISQISQSAGMTTP